MARIVRPLRGRLQVTLPFRPGSGNYDLLHDICGQQTKPEYNRERRYFEVAPAHLRTLIEQLPAELGRPVEVVLHGASQTRCVVECWRDASPDTIWTCVCSCAGKFHGTKIQPSTQIDDRLSVDTEYTTETYTAWPDGRVTSSP
ncbi:hypothetical protein [Candidatus Rhodoblastus alkanivorans]|uniref:Uncharacterized protein n=1 Tax=Candidatus Rhodoblastus alkanivorans TaxID=2954117 RepID=A0ABS9ZBI7_9HYPH|nr:hypothetical protein [Candidatus Rhodoblastus alkanivorans]MCI4685093.1 hypothetical protein [Candidatus Rhodoblastus alkanivorans]